MVLNAEFWRGRRVLVTGHTGFKGSWLSLWLQEMGAELAGFSLRPPTEPSLFELARVGESMRSVEADVRDLDAMVEAFTEHRPEIVLHLAAQPIVSRSLREPVATYGTNVMGIVHVLEAIRRSDTVRAFVNVTSDKSYENREWEWGYREGEPLGGSDPYSSSKACSEIVTAAYRRSYFEAPGRAAIATARAGNVIGGGDWAEDRLIPDVMRAALGGDRFRMRRPQAIRPWQHVLNPLSGYLLLAERLCDSRDVYADAWNFAPDEREAWPVERIFGRLCDLWGEQIPVEVEAEAEFHEASYVKLDSSKARMRLGWAPGWDLERALAAIVDWYRGYRDGRDVRETTVEQIRAHPAAAALAEALPT